LAIYHLTVGVISRGRGQSVVAAAAYRAGVVLRDEHYGLTHRYTRRAPAECSDIMAPAGAPLWVLDRQHLWNRVEAAESRKDAQLARVVELGIPGELSAPECMALLRDFVATAFVAHGMIVDLSMRRDNPANPHAHLLVSLRKITAAGFGPKQRQWNGKAQLLAWRATWAAKANEHLARAGHAVRIDHRTLEAQHIELTPTRRVGFGPSARDRLAERRRIARENGACIIEDPAVLLRALTQQRPVFTQLDLARFLRTRTDVEQFDAAYRAVMESADLIALPAHGAVARYTSRDLVEAEKSLMHRVSVMALRRGHRVNAAIRDSEWPAAALDPEERFAFDYLVGDGDAKAVAPRAAAAAALLAAARRAWTAGGLRVVDSPALAHESVTQQSILLVEDAELLALKELERLAALADKARAKLVLVGDRQRLGAMRVESAFRAVIARIGSSP
jgi:hypothetical protein